MTTESKVKPSWRNVRWCVNAHYWTGEKWACTFGPPVGYINPETTKEVFPNVTMMELCPTCQALAKQLKHVVERLLA